ncbi:MAG: nicotinate-nucleotide adenylyltransferase [Burkholderiaceae bacterium]|jgi:nicotinate-nucleotide adenylyltransferase|nr:nicotinate-nucleotide adenylyltransferase [Burkholderiaceae bacterium]
MIGILGGTFNPIHNGHLHLAERLNQTLAFEAIRFMPAAIPALKGMPNVSAEHRADMVKLAIVNHPTFEIDIRELEREGPSYTIDSLIALRKELGDKVSICWLIGSDAFARLNTWHRWKDLLNHCHFVVVKRPHSEKLNWNTEVELLLEAHQTKDANSLKNSASGKVLIQEIAALDISSTQIRQHIASKTDVSNFMPRSVMKYIQQHQLYQ